MTDVSFYVYALKDPRTDPPTPYYVGRGSGPRRYDHLVREDDTPRGQRTREIAAAGQRACVSILLEDVSEAEAIRAVARLIEEHGIESEGGLLTNTAVRRGVTAELDHAHRPPGLERELAEHLTGLLDTVQRFARANPGGITDADLVAGFDIGHHPPGHYTGLAHCLLDLLTREGTLRRDASHHRYLPATR